jgi:site-specific recombinase XerD
MIDSIYLFQSSRDKQRMAPMFMERERYLRYLSQIGTSRQSIKIVATMLLHVVRVLELKATRPVGMDEIAQGCDRWTGEKNPRGQCRTPNYFRQVALNWLRFQGALIPAPIPASPFDSLVPEFLNALRSERGLAPATLKAYGEQVSAFLKWLQPRCPEFSRVRALDLEEYVQARLEAVSRRSVASYCSTLKVFFGYAEQQKWCPSGIKGSICGPPIPRIAENLVGPPWEDVLRVIASIGNSKPADLRAKAMFLLCSVYGLRSGEVTGMKLEDIDWRKGLMTVRRNKRGKTQQFLLQSSVGEAIACYLEKARPRCTCRNVFVTLNPPYRPVSGKTMPVIFNPRIRALGIVLAKYGPHTLRRACATKLLRTGSSIQEIADFLGHSDLRSVSRYAKYDIDSLKSVAKFSLRGVL